MIKKLSDEARSLLGLDLTPDQLAALDCYQRELNTWNARFNLTAITDPDQFRVKHFLDSLTCSLAIRGTTCNAVVDIGTGAGFPGLPMKILYPATHLSLVDSIGKKIRFCQHVVRQLGLKSVTLIQERAERLGHQTGHRESYDWAVARAVANLPVLMEYLLPLVRIGGRALAMKGETGPAETQTAEHAIHLLGGRLQQIIPVTLPGVTEERFLIVVEKVAATPLKYPRRVGIPAKRPL